MVRARPHKCAPPQKNPLQTHPTHPLTNPAGAKTRDDIYKAFENIYPTLQQFRKVDAAEQLAGAMTVAPDAAAGPGPSSSMLPPPAARGTMLPPADSMVPRSHIPPATPLHPSHSGVPPATPAHAYGGLPPATPAHAYGGLPPATPAHGGPGGLPPATPAWQGYQPAEPPGFRAPQALQAPALPPPGPAAAEPADGRAA
jgi:hypothetical protein